MATENIAVLGTGTMGLAFARRLLGAGMRARVWDVSRIAAARLADRGAQVAETPEDAVRDTGVVLTGLNAPWALTKLDRIERDFDPDFSLALATKDLHLALDAATRAHQRLPIAQSIAAQWDSAAASGFGRSRRCRRVSRARARYGDQAVAGPSIGSQNITNIVTDQEHDVRTVLRALPTEQRTDIEFYFGGFTQIEIADLIGAPLGTIKGRIRLAMRPLKRLMTASGD